MTKPINGSTLKTLREKKGFSLKVLAGKSGVSVSQIVRLERGSDSPPRATTLAGLSKALNVETEQLTEEAISESGPAPLSPKQQANFRIASSARNALGLVAMRYRIDPGDIVEAAPLLFYLFAEGSLKAREGRLQNAWEKFDAVEREATGFPHLPKAAFIRSEPPAFDIEGESIRNRDLFAQAVEKGLDAAFVDDDRESYDDARQNPFVSFLRQIAGDWGIDADIEGWGPYVGPEYEICETEAHEFVGGDEEASRAILNGWAPLTELPDNLRRDDSDPAKRAEWAKARFSEWPLHRFRL